MKYHELLSKYIKESKLSLGEIVLRANKQNLRITKSYISKLKNGHKPPASEEVTRALAEVIGGDPEALVIAGYVDKAPPEIKQLLKQVEQAEQAIEDQIIEYLAIHIKDINCLSPSEKGYLFDLFEKIGVMLFEDQGNLQSLENFRKNILQYSSFQEKQQLLEMIKIELRTNSIDNSFEQKYDTIQEKHNASESYSLSIPKGSGKLENTLTYLEKNPDLKVILVSPDPISFDGHPINQEDKQRILDFLTGYLWKEKKPN